MLSVPFSRDSEKETAIKNQGIAILTEFLYKR